MYLNSRHEFSISMSQQQLQALILKHVKKGRGDNHQWSNYRYLTPTPIVSQWVKTVCL